MSKLVLMSQIQFRKAFQYRVLYRNIGGIAFGFDGNFNMGANPIYNAERIKFSPIFSFAVGGSIKKEII